MNLDQGKICYRYGVVGYLSKECPQCPCAYCRSLEHKLVECPKASGAPKRPARSATGPLALDSRPVSSPRRLRSIQEGRNKGHGPKRSLSEDLLIDHNQTVSAMKRTKSNNLTDEGFERKDELFNQGEVLFVFPDLVKLLEHMIEVICSPNNDKLLEKYRVFVNQKIGRDKLPRLLLQCIDHEVKTLQNQPVTIQVPKYVRRQQDSINEIFGCAGGYLNFITDDRDASYCKFYVGQSRNLAQRVREHSVSLFRGATSSLHYYIYALGKGHRSFCIIRLFNLISSPEMFDSTAIKDDESLFLNLLELAMGLAFQSLPNHMCNRFLKTRISLEPCNMHLNILCPLEQANRCSTQVREKARSELE